MGAALTELVLASRNAKKLKEMQALFAPLGTRLHLVSEFSDIEPEETGNTFVENALIKARHASRVSGLPALGDDSGLCVDALGGAPGLTSARYAGVHGDAAANIAKLLDALDGFDDVHRRAHFHCTIVLLASADDPAPLIAEGCWQGCILRAPRGTNGFGYDPVFFDPALGRGAAELDAATKNRVSHRGQALARLRELL